MSHATDCRLPRAPLEYTYAELATPDAPVTAALADECAVAFSYNGLSHAVLMASPQDLADLAIGFSLSQGIASASEIRDLSISGAGSQRQIELEIASRAFWQLKQQRRQLAGSTGCGLCGVEALEQALPPLESLAPSPLPPAAHLAGLRQRIAAAQQLGRRSGALHAALFVDDGGEIAVCREDIGRHNALDKLIGALARQQLDVRAGFAVVTSRCSLELIQKAVRAGIATLVSLSAPSALSVDWACRHHLNLIHLPHQSAPRVYSPRPSSPLSSSQNAEENPA